MYDQVPVNLLEPQNVIYERMACEYRVVCLVTSAKKYLVLNTSVVLNRVDRKRRRKKQIKDVIHSYYTFLCQ